MYVAHLSSYDKVLCIGHPIRTLPVQDSNKQNRYGEKYLGLSTDSQDIKTRCTVLEHVLKHLWSCRLMNKAKGLQDKKCLKIFMAPEFYFRPETGAYDLAEVSGLYDKLRQMIGAREFGQDWLFLFGTAVASLDDLTTTARAKEVFNFAIVIRGGQGPLGSSKTPTDSLLVYKEYISSADFIADQPFGVDAVWYSDHTYRQGIIGLPSEEPSVLKPTRGSRDLLAEGTPNPIGEGAEHQSGGLGGKSIFALEDLTLGLEVCVDHDLSRLRNSPPAVTQNYVQLQLIPSAGTHIVEKSVACVPNGILFNVDGHSESSEVKVNLGTFDHPKLSGAASIEHVLDLSQSSGPPERSSVFATPGKLVFHQALTIPPPKIRTT